LAESAGNLEGALTEFVGRRVVLDTAGPILYLGTLRRVTEAGFWLGDADLHDCRDGHATKEEYLADAHRHGLAPNRRRVFVMRSTVLSVTCLEDILIGDEDADLGGGR
jgi:hypothetical protein